MGASIADQPRSKQHRARACAATGVSPMTANLTACPATVPSMGAFRQSLDPVRARVAVLQQLTNDQMHKTVEVARHAADIVQRPPIHRSSGLHPGDVLYWITCVGGACLLLLTATK